MSKAKFEAAREFIQAKQYDQARRILQTIDHPKAKEWLAKIDEIDPDPFGAPGAIQPLASIPGANKKSPSGALPKVLLALVVVIGIAVGGVYLAKQYLPVPLPFIGCQYSSEDQRFVADFLDQSKTAMSVSRIALAGPIITLQKTQGDFKNARHPACAHTVTDKINDGMDFTVQALQEFAANNTVMTNVDLDLGAERFAQASDLCLGSWIYCPDSRLFDVNVMVWDRAPLTHPTPTAASASYTQTADQLLLTATPIYATRFAVETEIAKYTPTPKGSPDAPSRSG